MLDRPHREHLKECESAGCTEQLDRRRRREDPGRLLLSCPPHPPYSHKGTVGVRSSPLVTSVLSITRPPPRFLYIVLRERGKKKTCSLPSKSVANVVVLVQEHPRLVDSFPWAWITRPAVCGLGGRFPARREKKGRRRRRIFFKGEKEKKNFKRPKVPAQQIYLSPWQPNSCKKTRNWVPLLFVLLLC